MCLPELVDGSREDVEEGDKPDESVPKQNEPVKGQELATGNLHSGII
jgi:hypothetical protein